MAYNTEKAIVIPPVQPAGFEPDRTTACGAGAVVAALAGALARVPRERIATLCALVARSVCSL